MTYDANDPLPSEKRASAEWSDEAINRLWLDLESLEEEPENVLETFEEEEGEDLSIHED